MSDLLEIIGVAALFTCALAGFVLCRSVSLLTQQAGALYAELKNLRSLVDFLMRVMSNANRPGQDKATDSDNRE